MFVLSFRILRILLLINIIVACALCRTTGAPISRAKISINSNWRFLKADVADASNASFDDRKWQTVSLPHTWNASDPFDDEPGYFRGACWYRRNLAIPSTAKDKRLFLYFEGANQTADVYVNGKLAGRHIGGYTAFAFEITQFVNISGLNTVAVRVDNSFSENIPPLTADFNFYG